MIQQKAAAGRTSWSDPGVKAVQDGKGTSLYLMFIPHAQARFLFLCAFYLMFTRQWMQWRAIWGYYLAQ